jgi:EAL and modified HD-GYP domain-containing signal transduction protein
MDNIFVGRQPIFDRDSNLYAYELLFRDGAQNSAGVLDGDQATSQVIINVFLEIGLDRIVGPHRAFINLTRRFFTDQESLPLPAERVVLEVLEDVPSDPEVIAGLSAYVRDGYLVALDDFVFDESLRPLIELAHIIKIDLKAFSRSGLEEQVQLLRAWDVKLLAEKVETEEEFDYCRRLGFDYFQGFFLSRPNIVQGAQLPPNRLGVLQLLAKLQDPTAEASDLEEIIGHDVALSYKLLRYLNSAFFALPREVESLRAAVIYLGTQTIQRWASLLLLARLAERPSELMSQSLQRAKMCEVLAKLANRLHSDSYFTVGLFSLLDAVMRVPFQEIVEALPLTIEVHDALLRFQGPYGEALTSVIAYEQGYFRESQFADLTPAQMTEAYLESVSWASHATTLLRSPH